MTIHASKGLEFDVVVLPDLDSDMVRKSQVLVATHRPSPDLPYERVCRLPKKALRALDPTLQAWGTERQEALYLESINLLYVALTRAKHRLEIVVGAKPSDASPAQAIKDALDLPDPSELEEPIRAAGSQGVLLGQETYGETWVPEVAQPAQAESSPPEPQAVQWSTTAPPPGSRTRSPSQGARRTRSRTSKGRGSVAGGPRVELGFPRDPVAPVVGTLDLVGRGRTSGPGDLGPHGFRAGWVAGPVPGSASPAGHPSFADPTRRGNPGVHRTPLLVDR